MKAFQVTFNYITAFHRPLPIKVEVRGLDVLTQEQYLVQPLWEKNSPQPTVLATIKNFRIHFNFLCQPPLAVSQLFNLESFPWTKLVNNSFSVKRNMSMEKE